MTTRKIVKIDEDKCNGCGLCIPNCAEGALKIVDGKARLISERFCDGLGACLGHCPQDAITIIEREAEEFDELAVEAHLHQQANRPKPQPVVKPTTGCPSSRPIQFRSPQARTEEPPATPSTSMLSHWPVQLKLVPVKAPYFEQADLLVVADCVPFAYASFHQDFLRDKAVVVGCPKLDDAQYYREKLTEIFKTNSLKSITVPYMEVPCCFGLVKAVEDALLASKKLIPLKKVKIGIRGEIKSLEESGETRSLQEAHIA